MRSPSASDLVRRSGATSVYAGRQGPDEIATRVVVSLWSGRAAMVTATGPDLEESRFHPEYLPETADRIVGVMPLELSRSARAPFR